MCVHGTYIKRDKWYCKRCGEPVEPPTPKMTFAEGIQKDNKRRRPLTEWEEMKLGFYRNEKAWLDNIASREIVTKNGKKMTVYKDQRGNTKPMPSQPKHLLPKAQVRQTGFISHGTERIDR